MDTNEKESMKKMTFIDKIARHLSPRSILDSATASSSLVFDSDSEHYDDPEVYHDKRGKAKLLSGTKKSSTSNKIGYGWSNGKKQKEELEMQMRPETPQPLVRSDSRVTQSSKSSGRTSTKFGYGWGVGRKQKEVEAEPEILKRLAPQPWYQPLVRSDSGATQNSISEGSSYRGRSSSPESRSGSVEARSEIIAKWLDVVAQTERLKALRGEMAKHKLDY